MSSYTRRDFEIEFSRLNFNLKELAVYAALKLAKLRHETVAEPYTFLTNGDMPESEKRKLLLTVYDIAGNRIEFLSYVFKFCPDPNDDAKTIARMVNRDSYALIKKAKKHGIDIEKELSYVRERRRRILNEELVILDAEDVPTYLSFLFSEPGTMH